MNILFEEVERDIASNPTCMSAVQELRIMNKLKKILLPDTINIEDRLLACLIDLHASHTDSGYFEITPENEQEFLSFAAWVRSVGLFLENGKIVNLFEDFNISYMDLLEEYGSDKL